MKILHVISSINPAAGGPTTSFTGLVSAQALAGLQVTALAPAETGANAPGKQAMENAGAAVQLIGADVAAEVDDAVRQADVVHIHAVWEPIQYLSAATARRLGKPYLFEPCGMLTRWSLSQKRLKKWLYLRARLGRLLKNATAMHFNSELERDTSLKLRVPAIIEPNGVDLADFAELPDRGGFRAVHPQIGTRPVIAFLGRIHPGKGLEHLVPALAQVVQRGLDPVLVVIGPDSGGFKTTIDRMIAEHRLTDRVIFTGLLRGAEKVQALVDADLFCLPSDHENFGMAVIEALAARLPTVLSREVGVYPDIVAAGVGAAVSREPRALAAELSRWLTDDDLRKSAAAKARDFVRGRFDWQQIAGRWAGHYASIVANPQPTK